MNTPAEQPWSQAPDHMDAMAINSSELEELGNLFEFGDLDLSNIPSVDSTQYVGHIGESAGTHPSTPFDEVNEAQALGGSSAQDFGTQSPFEMPQHIEQAQKQRQYQARSHTFTSEPMYQPAMQTYHTNPQYQFQDLPGFTSNQHVPPTPNSFGMHGETASFMQHQQMDQQQRALLEQRFQMRKQDAVAFTPMASPIGTPQFNIQPEYTIPGAYFSPLTSPMLHAQNGQTGHQQHPGYYTNPSTAPSSNATSPLDPSIDVDMLGDEISLGDSASIEARKSSRRKAQTPRSAGPLARVKQSPIQKATKRKSGTVLSSLPATLESTGTTAAQKAGNISAGTASLQPQQHESSENGSISPEPLSDVPMGPPPRPGSSINQSPALAGQQPDSNTSQLGPAATPKSILSLRGVQGSSSGHATTPNRIGADDAMELEDLELPAAATGDGLGRPSLPQLKTQATEPASYDDNVPLSSRKVPKLGAGSIASGRSNSLVTSPSLSGSPMTASTPGAILKDRKTSDAKGGRNSKKRGSMSGSVSALVSPALRPRISPSIKPLLPEGASLHSQTHALLLASKSNYQNILEGNHLPGVNYPDSLSTGLTSKRTSHKVAEQGRRNRINEALKEMQSLLPKSSLSKGARDNSEGSPEMDGDGQDAKDDTGGKGNSSKAATVESANEYIRKLQKKLVEQETALKKSDAIRKENEELKRKLEGRSPSAASAAPSSSPATSPAA